MHWLTTTWEGGYILGVSQNLVASALVIIPILLKKIRTLEQEAERRHRAHMAQSSKHHMQMLRHVSNTRSPDEGRTDHPDPERGSEDRPGLGG